MSNHKNTIIGYYLKVSKVLKIETYNSKYCKLCNKEFENSNSEFCDIHGCKLEIKTEIIKDFVNINFNYDEEFCNYCKNNNYKIPKSGLTDIAVSVYDTNSHEYLICNVNNPSIYIDITYLEGEEKLPDFLGKLAWEYFESVINFLTHMSHKVELKLGILTYWN